MQPHVAPPDRLPGFPGARRVKPKTRTASGMRARWKDDEGMIYEWDYRHGTVEKYDARGRHQGEFDPVTGQPRGRQRSDRQVEP